MGKLKEFFIKELPYVVGLLGLTSALVTMFVDTNSQISIKWLIFCIFIFCWILGITLRAYSNLEAENNTKTQEYSRQLTVIESQKNDYINSLGDISSKLEIIHQAVQSEAITITATCIPFKIVEA